MLRSQSMPLQIRRKSPGEKLLGSLDNERQYLPIFTAPLLLFLLLHAVLSKVAANTDVTS